MEAIIRRLIQLVVVLVIVTFFTSILSALLPGDPVETIAPFATAQQRTEIRDSLGLDQNIVVRYGQWLGHFVTGDMGREYTGAGVQGPSVYGIVKNSLPRSLLLMIYVQILTLLIAVPLGVYTAYRAGTRFDGVANGIAFGLFAIPAYVAATLMILFLSVQHKILPSEGWVSFASSPVEHFKHLIMPVVAITIGQFAIYARLLRTDMVATLQEDYILMAKSKGISDRRILWRHALRPSSLTLLTVAGLNVGSLISGALIIEVIFHLNGIGYQLQQAIATRQYIALQDFVAVVAIVYVLVNFAVDALYRILDPRIHAVLESAETEITGTDSTGAPLALDEEVTPSGKRKGMGVLAWIAIGWLGLLVFLAVFASVLPLKDPISGDYVHPKAGMFTPGHILGTDESGRDVLSRVIWGAQASLLIGVGSIALGTLIGGFFGLFAGFKGRTTDTVLSAVFNILLAFPQLVLALTLVSVFSPPGTDKAGWSRRMVVVIIAVGIVSIPILARITRANTLAWSQREFVMAARAQGATDTRVMFREVLPNVVPSMLSIALLSIAVVIVLEGALAIFGLSIPVPSPSWGNMIQSQISDPSSAPTVWMVPSFLILTTVLALNYLGDVVRSRFDVREGRDMSRHKRAAAPGTERFADAPLDGSLLELDEVKTQFTTPRGLVHAVDGVSFTLERGKTIGIVGESGCGKSVLSRSIMGLLPSNVVRHGSIRFEGNEIGHAKSNVMRPFWGTQMSMVFQDPMTSLNPVMRIGNQIMESVRFHFDVTKEYAEETAVALLTSVGIPEAERRLRQYPHELSGGMRQRVMIAIALACGPKLLFADEPTTALDVTVQAQILDLLQEQQRERFMAMVLVTHDLGVVAGRTDDIAVMYAGRIVERAPTRSLFEHTRHPYTEALLKSIPKLSMPSHSRLDAIAGRPPDLVKPPRGCKFPARCPYAQPKCLSEEPPLIDPDIPGHAYRCFFPVGSQAGADALTRNLAAGETATGLPVRKDGEAVLTGVTA